MAHTFPTRKTESAHQLSGPITTTKPVILTNIPRTNDVFDMVSLLRSAGTSVTWLDLNTLSIHQLATDSLDIEASRRTRAVDLLVAALAKDQDDFIIPKDCSFGDRSFEPHVDALEKLGRKDSAVCECVDQCRC
jgi:UDP-N-acetylglucosamine enolpyruvyl transferase